MPPWSPLCLGFLPCLSRPLRFGDTFSFSSMCCWGQLHVLLGVLDIHITNLGLFAEAVWQQVAVMGWCGSEVDGEVDGESRNATCVEQLWLAWVCLPSMVTLWGCTVLVGPAYCSSAFQLVRFWGGMKNYYYMAVMPFCWFDRCCALPPLAVV